jgi:hypothetical protein
VNEARDAEQRGPSPPEPEQDSVVAPAQPSLPAEPELVREQDAVSQPDLTAEEAIGREAEEADIGRWYPAAILGSAAGSEPAEAAEHVAAVDEPIRWGAAQPITPGRVAVWLAVFSFLCFAYFLPHWDWNQTARVDMTVAAANHGTFAIDRYQGNTGDKDFFRGHYYSSKAPGQSLIGVPIYLGYKLFMSARGMPAADTADDPNFQYLDIVVTGGIPAILLLLLFFWFLGHFSTSLFNRALLTLALGLGTNIFAYTQQLFGHVPAAALLFTGFVLVYILARKDAVTGAWTARLAANPDLTAVLAGLALGTAILVEYPPAVIAFCIGIYALLRVPRRHLPYMVVGAMPPLMMIMAYDYAVYGNPFTLGYTSGASVIFKGAQTPGFGGIAWPPKVDAIDGLSFGTYRGLFFLSPFLLLAFPGYRFWRQRGDREWMLFFVIPILYFIIMTMYTVWSGGLAVGPRFLIPMVPFLAVPVIFVLDRVSTLPKRDVVRGLVYGLIGISIANTWAQSIAGTNILLPPENNYNPLFTASLPELGSGQIWTNRAMDLGLTGVASLLPLAALLAAWTVAVFWTPLTRWGRQEAAPLAHLLTPLLERRDDAGE